MSKNLNKAVKAKAAAAADLQGVVTAWIVKYRETDGITQSTAVQGIMSDPKGDTSYTRKRFLTALKICNESHGPGRDDVRDQSWREDLGEDSLIGRTLCSNKNRSHVLRLGWGHLRVRLHHPGRMP
jgi:hypothetical protein